MVCRERRPLWHSQIWNGNLKVTKAAMSGWNPRGRREDKETRRGGDKERGKGAELATARDRHGDTETRRWAEKKNGSRILRTPV
jgi:hypothetical protein